MAEQTVTPEAVQGKNIVFMVRKYADRKTKAASSVIFQTDYGRSLSADIDATATKDGNVNTPKPASTEVTASLILSTQDDLIDALEDACQNGDLLEIWEINLQKPTTVKSKKPMKYKGKYMQGTLTSFELSAKADDLATYDSTFSINGKPQKGEVTVSKENQAEIDYVFADTTATPGV